MDAVSESFWHGLQKNKDEAVALMVEEAFRISGCEKLKGESFQRAVGAVVFNAMCASMGDAGLENLRRWAEQKRTDVLGWEAGSSLNRCAE